MLNDIVNTYRVIGLLQKEHKQTASNQKKSPNIAKRKPNCGDLNLQDLKPELVQWVLQTVSVPWHSFTYCAIICSLLYPKRVYNSANLDLETGTQQRPRDQLTLQFNFCERHCKNNNNYNSSNYNSISENNTQAKWVIDLRASACRCRCRYSCRGRSDRLSACRRAFHTWLITVGHLRHELYQPTTNSSLTPFSVGAIIKNCLVRSSLTF